MLFDVAAQNAGWHKTPKKESTDMSKYRDLFFRTGLLMILVIHLASPVIDCLRLLKYSHLPSTLLFYVQLPLLSLLFGTSIIPCRTMTEERFDPMEITILSMLLFSSLSFLSYRGQPIDAAGNLLRLILTFSCYRGARKYYSTFINKNFIYRLALFGGIGGCISLLLLYTLGVFGPRPIYLGMSTDVFFPALAIVLAERRTFSELYSMLLFSLIFLGGKRGFIIAAGFQILAYAAIGAFIRRSIGTSTLKIVACFLALYIASLSTVSLSTSQAFLSKLPSSLTGRFTNIYSEETGVNWNLLLSGRESDLFDALRAWKNEPYALFSGFGLGATVTSPEGITRSTIHFSPLAISYIFGVILFGVFYWQITMLLLKKILSWRAIDFERKVLLLLSVGLLGVSNSVYSILQDPLLWLALGKLASNSYSSRQDMQIPYT